jgi:DHA1 family multidrug resistance protein-like MFS transporter
LASASPLLKRIGGVATVGFLTYFGEYISFIVVLAWISDKLTITYGAGVFGYTLVGTISGVFLVASGLIAVPMGHLCDRYGRGKVAVLGCAFGASGLFSLILISQALNITSFLFGVSLALSAIAVGHGTYTAATLAYVGDVSRNEDLGKSYGLIEDVEFAGYAFGPGLGGVISLIAGRELTFAISALTLLAGAGVALIGMHDVRQNPSIRSEDKLSTSQIPSGTSWAEFVRVMADRITAATLLTTLVISLAFTSFFIYVSIYGLNLSSVPIVRAIGSASGSIMAATSIAAIIPLGHLEDVTGRRMVILSGGLVMGAIALSFVFSSPTLFAFVSASLVFGVALAMARVSEYVILSERSELGNRASIMGTNHAIEHAGYGLGAFFGGVLISFLGATTAFRLLSVVLLLSGLFFFLFALRRNIK